MSRKIPKCRTEKEERDFWNSADSSDNINWMKGRKIVLPKLKLTANGTSQNPKKA